MFTEDFADIFEHQATPQFALVEEVVDAVLRTNESEGPIRGEFLDDALHDVPLACLSRAGHSAQFQSVPEDWAKRVPTRPGACPTTMIRRVARSDGFAKRPAVGMWRSEAENPGREPRRRRWVSPF